MDFSFAFACRVVLGLGVGALWFGVPGWLALRACEALPLRGRAERWLCAPLWGMAVYGMPALLLHHLVPFRLPHVLVVYALFNLALYRLGRERAVGGEAPLSRAVVRACGLGALVLAALHVLPITPRVWEGGLYLDTAIYDHAKLAIVDAIHRHGLPPITPYYHPGHDVPLNYYYGFHFLAAQLRLLCGIDGWSAEVAMTLLTAQGVIALCVASAFMLERSWLAPLGTGCLLACGSLLGRVHALVHTHGLPDWLVPFTNNDKLGPSTGHLLWQPQHVIAMGMLLLLLHVLARLAAGRRGGPGTALVIGALLACVLSCSVWIAVASAVVLPFTLLVLLRSLESAPRLRARLERTLGRALLPTLLLSAPVGFAMLNGPGQGAGLPLRVELIDFTRWDAGPLARFAYFWTVALPQAYGATLVLGPLGLLWLWREGSSERRGWLRLALSAIVGFLLVTQLLRSTVANNDLGWAAHGTSYLLLATLGGAALARAFRRLGAGAVEPRVRAPLPSGRVAALTALAVSLPLLAIGLGVGVPAAALRQRAAPPVTQADPETHRRLLGQAEAWAKVREHVGAEAIVQSNPDGYARVILWPINLPFMLFADRTAAVGEPFWAFVYASRAPRAERERAIEVVRQVFTAEPSREAIGALREDYGVRAVLVDRADGLWPGTALAASGLYAQVHATDDYRIYVATTP